MSRFWTLALISVVAIGGVTFVTSVNIIGPYDETLTAIGESFYRLHLYAKANGRLPDSLSELPERERYVNQTKDAWD